MEGIYQASRRGLNYLALAGGIAALSGCDTPEVKVLYQSPSESSMCSIRLEQIVQRAAKDNCRLEVGIPDGKTLLVLDEYCFNLEGLRINGSNGKSYILKMSGDPYLVESKPPK